MNVKPAKQWSAALRSGEYTQTKHVLGKIIKGEERNCCLGMLCRINNRPSTVIYQCVEYDNSAEFPYFDKVGLSECHDLSSNKEGVTFDTLNDKQNYTFDEIADVIDLFIYSGEIKYI